MIKFLFLQVLVATHIPPGMSNTPGKLSMHDNFHSVFVSILQKYTDTITGIHCGHDHADKIKLLADITGELNLCMLFCRQLFVEVVQIYLSKCSFMNTI